MSDRTLLALARALFGVVTALLIGGAIAAIVVTAGGTGSWTSVLPNLAFMAMMFTFPMVGIIIARRQPRNAVAWLLLAVGLTWQTEWPIRAFIDTAVRSDAGVQTAAYVAALTGPLWVWGLAPLGTFLLLLFPDGHLPSPKWRWLAWASGAVMVLASLGIILWPGPIEGFTPVTDNPLGLVAMRDQMPFVLIGIPVCMLGSAVALIQRFRRSRGVERLQLKWLAAAAATVAVVYFVTMVASLPYDWIGSAPTWVGVLQNVSLATFVLIPIAVGVAITRYRLYDIDRLINRALVYALVSAALVLVYVVGVVGAGGAFRAITGQEQGNLAVAGSTLAVAALFRPLRARVQRFIDRRFYRRRYDATLTVEAFSSRLRQETDLTSLSEQLQQVVSDTIQPTSVTLWIASRD
jgi:hypothetical protein